MSIENLKRPERIDEDKIEKLKELFPDAFIEGVLNIDKLREELTAFNDESYEEGNEEFYSLNWAGKKEARKLAMLPPSGTLKFVENEGINEKDTRNIFIEGDNLEVLRQIKKSYSGRIKLIFIDPPYNTGSDLIYEDDFKEPTEKYLQKTGQADEEGLLTANPKANGRFHTNWLNMMYPRLKLARSLLRDDGVICITIGEEEVSNLKLVTNEIFGESNFLGCIIWKKKTNGNNVGFIPSVHDYILCYARNVDSVGEIGLPISKEYIEKNYSNPDNDSRGPWTVQDLSANHVGPYFPITNPLTGEVHLPPKGRYWVFNEEEVKKRIKDGRIIFGKSGTARPVQKVFLLEKKGSRQKSDSLWDNHGMNSDGTEELTQLFGIPKLFSHPKPSKLLKNILSMFTNSSSNDIVLDFFAGSGTTGHAVYELNKEDKGNRQFVLIQLPEKTNNPQYPLISEITKSRLKKVVEKLNNDDANKNGLDRGFSAFKMGKSNIRKWQDFEGNNINSFQQMLDLFTDSPFIEEAKELDIIIELMLHQGFPLDAKIEKETRESNLLWIVQHDNVPFTLVVCLDDKLHDEVGNYLSLHFVGGTFICLDNALSNEQKILLSESMNVKTI